MSAEDEDLYGKMVRIENKDVFVDLKKNANGMYLKLSERRGNLRKTVLIPASGISKLQQVLEEVSAIANKNKPAAKIPKNTSNVSKLSSQSSASETVNSNSIYVAGLTWETNEDQLKNHFASVGTVVKTQILRKPRAGKVVSMGCGTVEFATVADAVNAINQMNETEFQGRTISCRADRKSGGDSLDSKPERQVVPNKIFVSNIPSDTSTEDVVEFFSRAGDVKKIEKMASSKGKKKGIWIVEFEQDEAALDAIHRLNDAEFDGNTIFVREYSD